MEGAWSRETTSSRLGAKASKGTPASELRVVLFFLESSRDFVRLSNKTNTSAEHFRSFSAAWASTVLFFLDTPVSGSLS